MVMGENINFIGAEKLLHSEGVELVNMDDEECKKMMSEFIRRRPEDWKEDVGE